MNFHPSHPFAQLLWGGESRYIWNPGFPSPLRVSNWVKQVLCCPEGSILWDAQY